MPSSDDRPLDTVEEEEGTDESKDEGNDGAVESPCKIDTAPSQDDSCSVASSVADPRKTSPLKWLQDRGAAREEYSSDSESQFTYSNVAVPSVLSIGAKEGPSSPSVLQLLGGSRTFSSDDDDNNGQKIRRYNFLKKIGAHGSPTSACEGPSNPASPILSRDDDDESQGTEDDPLRVAVLALRDGDEDETGSRSPFDETLEDEQDLESFAEELELKLAPARRETSAKESQSKPRDLRRQVL